MKLYEINEEIQRLADQVEYDPETGELLCDATKLYAQLNELQMERKTILEYLAKLVLNTRAEAVAIKNEEARLKERRSKIEKKEKRLMEVLDRECAGQKTDLGIATVSYRQTSRIEVSDVQKAVEWLNSNNHSDCYRVPTPEVAKAEVKRLISDGTAVPGCCLINDYSCSLR